MNDELAIQNAACAVWATADFTIRTEQQFQDAKRECLINMQFRLDAVRSLTLEEYLKHYEPITEPNQ